MERKECPTGLQIIKCAGIKLKGNFSSLFMGAFAMCTPLILVLFLTSLFAMLFEALWVLSIGVVLFIIFVGPLQVGYIKYFNSVLDGNQPKISLVYSQIRFSVFTLRTIYISGLLLIMYVIGGVLWLVPAGFAVSAYSMTLFFLEKFEYPRLSLAMNECSKKMIGNRLKMFSYKFIFYIMYMILFAIGLLCFVLVYSLSLESLIISWIVSLCSVIVFIFLYTYVTVYFHTCNQIFFEDILARDERIKTEKATESKKIADTENVDTKSKDKEEKTTKSSKEKDLKDSKNTKDKVENKDEKLKAKDSEVVKKESKEESPKESKAKNDAKDTDADKEPGKDKESVSKKDKVETSEDK